METSPRRASHKLRSLILTKFAVNMFNCSPVLTVLLLILACVQLEAAKENDPVTCGSVIKLIHKETVRFVLLQRQSYAVLCSLNLSLLHIFFVVQGNNLHSHGIAWGSGSGQQSVTTNSVKNDKGNDRGKWRISFMALKYSCSFLHVHRISLAGKGRISRGSLRGWKACSMWRDNPS